MKLVNLRRFCGPAALFRGMSVALVLVIVVGGVCRGDSPATPADPPRVLVLYSQRRELPVNEQWARGIRAGLEANLDRPVAIDSEYLDFHRLEKNSDRQALLDLVLSKYGDIRPDVVIPVSDAVAGLFVRRNPFPDAPVVFCSILEETRERLPTKGNATGVLYRFAPRRTVQCARRLVPSLRTVIVISGTGEQDLFLLEPIRADLAFETDVQCEYWTGIPIDSLCERVSRLPPNHVILFNSYMRHADGEIATVPRDVLRRISSASSVPVFALYDTLMGTGIVGGCMAPVEEQGRLAGEMAARILRGENSADIPFSGTEMNRFVFDWAQLRRWGIRESDLPADALVLYRSPTLWEEYRVHMLAGLTTVVLQSILITTLLIQRRSRLQAERELARQLRFESLLSELSSRFVHVEADSLHAEIDAALVQVLEHLGLDVATVFVLSQSGRELLPLVGRCRIGAAAPLEVIALDSISWLWARLCGGQGFRFASPLDWPPDAVHERQLMSRWGWKAGVVVALCGPEAVFGFLALGQITNERVWEATALQGLNLIAEVIASSLARARTAAALTASQRQAEQLAGRILTAQEDERRRIARELHDDISQRLAAGAIEAGKAEQELGATSETRAVFTGLKEHLITLSDDVHRLSRRLHPAILDDLGLGDALRAECDRVARHGQVDVNFRCGKLPGCLPRNLALCVYRVAQESLHNAVKHAHAERIDVTLQADLEFLDLEIRDDGQGFDRATAHRGQGLGLAGMEERVRQAGGEFSLVSRPGAGTCVQVRVPLSAQS